MTNFVMDWVARYAAPELGAEVRFSLAAVTSGPALAVLATGPRPNGSVHRRRPVRIEIAPAVGLHLKQSRAAELARTGRKLTALIHKSLYAGGYRAEDTAAHAFRIPVDGSVLGA